MIRHLPNALTCCNLLCGCLAIIQAMQGHLFTAGYFVFAALVFDFLDGFLARLLGVVSAIGRDLDSLADMVTFGVAPGAVMFDLINIACWVDGDPVRSTALENLADRTTFFPAYLALLIPLFSGIRLAKFNNDPRQGDVFYGVPTPANAMLVCSIPFIGGIGRGGDFTGLWLLNPTLLCAVSAVMSLLLVSNIPLVALKFKSFGWKENRLRWLVLGVSGLLIALLQFRGIPLAILFYIAVSAVNNIFSKKPLKS